MVRAGSPFTSIVSVVVRSFSHAPFHFTSFGFAGLSSSTNTSASSVPVAVRPHATSPLCPRITPGRPGSVAPTTFQPGAFRCTRYRHAGSVTWRCGSSTINGLPLAVKAPLIAQLLLPGERSSAPSAKRRGPQRSAVRRRRSRRPRRRQSPSSLRGSWASDVSPLRAQTGDRTAKMTTSAGQCQRPARTYRLIRIMSVPFCTLFGMAVKIWRNCYPAACWFEPIAPRPLRARLVQTVTQSRAAGSIECASQVRWVDGRRVYEKHQPGTPTLPTN